MILESIFRGSLSPTDLVYPADPEYKQLRHEVVELSDQLSQTLTPPYPALNVSSIRMCGTAQPGLHLQTPQSYRSCSSQPP